MLVALNYFLFFASVGSFVPFIPLYLQAAGWGGSAIGLYSAIGPFVTFLTQPLWGYFGDLWGNMPLLFALLMLATGASIFTFGFLPVSAVFYLLPVLVGFFQGPLSPMLDSMSVRILGDEKINWGKARLWGSIGFAAVSFLVGRLLHNNSLWLFASYGIGSIFTALAVIKLPFQSIRAKEANQNERFELKGLKSVLTRPFLTFLFAMFILQLGQYMPANFLSLVMSERGASSSLIGLVWSVTAIVEIPIFLYLGKFLAKYGPERLLTLAAFFGAVRLTFFAFAYHPLFMLVAQSLEGFAFAPILVALVLLVDDLVPVEYHGTGFTLQVAATVTLPQLLAGLIGGKIFEQLGGTALYLISAALTVIGTFSFIIWRHSMKRPEQVGLSQN